MEIRVEKKIGNEKSNGQKSAAQKGLTVVDCWLA
jgi:hypothetical protein